MAAPRPDAGTGAALDRYVLVRGALTTGAAVSSAVLPVVAATTLHAGSTAMGLLAGIGLVVSLVLQIPLAVWSDRRRDQLRLLVRAAALSGLVSLTVPVLWWTGSLTLTALFGAMLATAAVAAVRSSLGHAIVNDLAPPDRRVDAVGRLNGVTSGGQSAGGSLIAVLAAPLVPLVDAALAVGSALLLRSVPAPPAPAAPDPAAVPVRLAGVAAGLLRRPAMWLVVAVGAIGGLTEPVFLLYVLRDLGIPPAAVGALVSCGAVGGIAGGFLVGRLTRSLGERRTLLLGTAAMALSTVPLVLARSTGAGAVAVVLFELCTALGGTVLVATVFGRLQATTDRAATTRTMSAAEVLLQVVGLLGLGAGILLATAVDRRTCFVAYLVATAAVLLVQLVARRPAGRPGPG